MNNYFSHDYHSRNDKKLVMSSMRFGLEALGAYWAIVEMIYEEGGYLSITEYERITFELRTSEELIKYLIHDSLLFENDGVKFWSNTVLERLKLRAEKSEKARTSIEARWNKPNNTIVLPTNNKRITSKEKENKINKINTTSEVEFNLIETSPPEDDVERNWPALVRRLKTFNAPIKMTNEIILLSNYGEKGNLIWTTFTVIDTSQGQIKMPVNYILSRLKA
jgi:hypothetical protein